VDKGLLFSGDMSTLFRASLDGAGRTVLVTKTSVTDVKLDLAHGKIYWSYTSRDFINRANLDGSGAETIIRLNYVDLVAGLALDSANGKLFLSYCTSPAASAIRVANLDGLGMVTFKQLAATAGPFEIELDTDSGTLYWNEYHGGLSAAELCDQSLLRNPCPSHAQADVIDCRNRPNRDQSVRRSG